MSVYLIIYLLSPIFHHLSTSDWKRFSYRIRCLYGWWWRRTISLICTYSKRGILPLIIVYLTFLSFCLSHPFVPSIHLSTLVILFSIYLSLYLSFSLSPFLSLIFVLLHSYIIPPHPSLPLPLPPPSLTLSAFNSFFLQEFFFFQLYSAEFFIWFFLNILIA